METNHKIHVLDDAGEMASAQTSASEGRVIEDGFTYHPAAEVAVGEISPAELCELQAKLRDVQRAQAIGRISGQQYFISL